MACTSTLEKPSSVVSQVENGVVSGPTVCVPEDLKLPPGQLSTVDRTGLGHNADVFRCFGCTKAECQVCSDFLGCPCTSCGLLLRHPNFNFLLMHPNDRLLSLHPASSVLLLCLPVSPSVLFHCHPLCSPFSPFPYPRPIPSVSALASSTPPCSSVSRWLSALAPVLYGVPSICRSKWHLPPVPQGSRGCANNMWRYEPDGYLREVLTARVYDVAIQSPLVRVSALESMLCQQPSLRTGRLLKCWSADFHL